MDNTIQLYVDKKKEKKGYPITSPDRVIDENGVNIKDYVDEAIDNAKLEGGDTQVDLSSYAKKTDLHDHENKEILDTISANKINEWDNKSTFSGSYNDLTNKPTIPTKTSQLTNDSGFITAVPSEYINETELQVHTDQVLSAGEQLVLNGSQTLQNNYNFSQLTYDGSQANNSAGSLLGGVGKRQDFKTDYFFVINPNKPLYASFDIKGEVGSKAYGYVEFYDVDKQPISASHHMYQANTLTKLTQDLKNGDTVVHLEDLTNWKETLTATHQKSFIFWNYTNKQGYTYPPETYSRNMYSNLYTNSSSVNKTNNTITLSSAWNKGTIPAGTYLSQGSSGNNYKYILGGSLIITTEWKTFSGGYDGVDYTGKNDQYKLPPGTAFAKFAMFLNYNGVADEKVWITNIVVKEDMYSDLTSHKDNTNIHVTATEKSAWNAKSNFDGDYEKLSNKPTIPAKTSQLSNDSGFITSIPSEYVTDSELSAKGYLTQHQDISHLASKSEVVEYVFPEQFGAKGDGVTDDSVAIQQAIQYAIDNTTDTYYHKPIVYMGAKTYKINTGIVLDKRCMQLHCDGKILYNGTDKALSIKHSLMNIYINNIEAPNGTALFLTGDEHQCVTNNIKINRIENSVNGIHLHNFGGSQSMFYNRMDIGSVHSTNICIHIQTDSGYINENYFWLGKLSGADIGIKIVKGGGNRFFKGSFEDLKSNSDSIALWLDNAEANVLRNFRCEENYGKSIIKFVGNNNWNDVWVSHMQLGAIDISELTGGSNNKLRGTIMTGNAGGGGYGAGDVADVSYATGITYNPLCANYWKKLTSTAYTNNVIDINRTTTSDGTVIVTSFDFDSTTNGKTFTLGALYSEYQSIARGVPIVFKFDSGVGRILLKDNRGGTIFDNTNGIYDGRSISVCWNGFDKVSDKNFWSIQILGVENEKTTNKVVAISSASTNEQYPSAKCVYDAISRIDIPEKVFEINNGDFNVIDEPKYQNMLRQAIDTDGNIYNNIGYKSKIRINSSKQEVAYDYSDITGFMDCTGISDKDVIYINGFSFVDEYYNGMVFYDANFNILQNLRINSNGTVSTTTKVQEVVYIDGGTKATKLAENSYVISFNFNESICNSYPLKYVRFYALRNADIKISLNNPIIETESYNAGTVVQTINNKKGHVTLPVLAYGTCSTTASTAEKAVVIDDPNWKLEVGNIIAIKPSVSNSASNVKFNVNGTGAYPLWYNNAEYTSSSTAYTGYANRIAFYMFNGTHWVWLGQSYVASVSQATLGQGYAVCDTAESTLAKACTISSYSLAVGGIVSIKFTNAVPANSTLNIRTRGAKPIFYRGVTITNGIIKAGDTATFIYNGTQYHLISLDNAVGNIPTKTSQLTNDSNFATKDYVDEQLVEREGLPIVNSIEEMTDTSKQYVYIETGTIWEYQEVQYSSKRYTNYYDAERYGTDTYLNKRINSSKQLEEANGMASTDWITLPQVLPAGTPVVIRLKNTKLATGTSRFFLMNLSGKGSQFTADDGNTNKEFTAAYPTYNNAFTLSYEGDVKVYTSKPPNTEVAQVAFAVNINEGQVITKSDVENVIITVNEPIDETPLITSEWKWVDTGEYDTKGGTIVVQELGDNPIAVMSQRAVTEAIDELKGLDIVASTEEMTDKKKKYVHKDTNTIWEHVEYEAVVKNNEFSKTTGKLNTRISSSGSESSRDGCFLTDYIDISDHTLPYTLNLSGVPELFSNYDAFYHFSFYDENKSLIVSANSSSYGHTPASDGDILKLPITISNIYPTEKSLLAKYVRIRLSIKNASTSISWSDVENLVINLAWKDKTQMISQWVDTGEYDNSHGVTVVQEAGISPSLVMSQKAVTELIQNATGGGTVNLPRVDSVEEMTDTTQSYVLTTTNTVWSYMETEGDPIELYDISKVTYNARYSGSPGSQVAYDGYSLTDYIPVDNTADDPQLIIEYDGTINTDLTTQPYFNKMTPHDANKSSIDVVYMNHGSVNSWKYDILTNKLVVHFKYLGDGSAYANLNSLAYVRLDVKHANDTGPTVMAKIKSIKCPTIKEKISAWTDTGMSAEQANTSYMDLVVKISENEEYINEVSRRVTKIETGSGSVSVPGFWTSAVDDCIAKIKNNQQGRNCVTFPFFSDHHVRGGYVGALIAKVMQECNIPYCLFGGDSISSGYMKDGVSEMIRDEYKFKDLMSYIPEGRLIRTPGNHDGYCAVSADERYYYTKDQIYDLFFRDIAIQQNKHFDSDGTSLYVDDLASKTRFIMLDTNKKMVNNSATGKTVTDEQLAWLKNEAMKFDEPGWAIVFSSHQPMSNHYHAGISNPEEVYSLLTSYKDSSDTNKADIVGWFSGHIHRDRIWTGKAINTSDDQQGDALPFTQVTISSDATAIAYDDATKHSYGADDQSHCIDFVTINKNTRTVKITRLGIGEDREFTY